MNSRSFINRVFSIPDRPFFFSAIYVEADDQGGKIHLTLRSALYHSEMSQAFRAIEWHKHLKWDNDDSLRWYFKLAEHPSAEIQNLIRNIFNKLNKLSSEIKTSDRIQHIQVEVHKMFSNYFESYKANFIFPPPAEYLINDEQLNFSAKNSHEAEALYHSVIRKDIEKTHHLLLSGVNPDLYYDGWTPLNAAIAIGANSLDDTASLSKTLSIILLLLEYGANPMLEDIERNTAFERTVKDSLSTKIDERYYAEIVRLLTASDSFYPHMLISNQAKKTTMGSMIHGSNLFYKKSIDSKNQIPKIIGVIHEEDLLHFSMSDNKVITVKTMPAYQISSAIHQELFEIFKRNFPWQEHIRQEGELKKYFRHFFEEPSTLIDIVSIDQKICGFNIASLANENINGEEIVLHYIKLASADKVLRDIYRRFMSIISFKRGFEDHYQSQIFTFFEAASISSYLQVQQLEVYPKVQTENIKQVMAHIAKKISGSVVSYKNNLYLEDDLAVAKQYPAPISFWDGNAVAVKAYENKYQIDKHSLLMGFFNSEFNLKQLEKKINSNCLGIQFRDILNSSDISFKQAKL